MVARTERWEEEVLLLREEMRRIITSFDHKAQWWRSQATIRNISDPVLASGISGYAEKQAQLREELATDFAALWLQGVEDAKLPEPKTWPSLYLKAKSTDRQVKRRVSRVKARLRVIGSQPSDNEKESDLPGHDDH